MFTYSISTTSSNKCNSQVSNAYLQFLTGAKTIRFDFVKEMPKGFTSDIPDLGAFIGPVLFTWVVLQLFPVRLIMLMIQTHVCVCVCVRV